MTRYYYTDPLAAAWMAKAFEMQFGIRHGNGGLVWDWMDMLNVPHPARTAEDILEDYPNHSFGSLYIHPDSLRLLEPQEGDCLEIKDQSYYGGTHIASVRHAHSKALGLSADHEYRGKDFKIIRRDGKPFYWPESEAS